MRTAAHWFTPTAIHSHQMEQIKIQDFVFPMQNGRRFNMLRNCRNHWIECLHSVKAELLERFHSVPRSVPLGTSPRGSSPSLWTDRSTIRSAEEHHHTWTCWSKCFDCCCLHMLLFSMASCFSFTKVTDNSDLVTHFWFVLPNCSLKPHWYEHQVWLLPPPELMYAQPQLWPNPTTSTWFDRSCGFPVSYLCTHFACLYCGLERGEEGNSTLGLISTRWQGFWGAGGLCRFNADTATPSLFHRTVAQNVVTFAIQSLAGGVWQSRIRTMLVKNGQEHLWFCSQHSSTHLCLRSGAVSFVSCTFG